MTLDKCVSQAQDREQLVKGHPFSMFVCVQAASLASADSRSRAEMEARMAAMEARLAQRDAAVYSTTGSIDASVTASSIAVGGVGLLGACPRSEDRGGLVLLYICDATSLNVMYHPSTVNERLHSQCRNFATLIFHVLHAEGSVRVVPEVHLTCLPFPCVQGRLSRLEAGLSQAVVRQEDLEGVSRKADGLQVKGR